MAVSPYTIHRAGRGVQYEHRLIAMRILGRELKRRETIHHVDFDEKNNDHDNLVICPDQKYHMLLHRRQRAFDATGDADKRKCQYCKEWDSPENLYIKAHAVFHMGCNLKYRRDKRK